MRYVFALLAALLVSAGTARADDGAWTGLKAGGRVVLMRHGATDPGTGDPPGFRADDCATQRNLNEEGRRSSRALGEAWRARSIRLASLVSSPWCRCLETARLAFGQEAQVDTALSNLFGRRENEASQLERLKALVSRRPAAGNAVLVTHGSTIHAFTGIQPAQGEMVVLALLPGGGYKVEGRLAPTAWEPGRPTSARP
ncbi:MAG: histidine phosphatase family protein [Burkholderiales bacterium]|nr:histidine phosphatase family protein [Burkholderiales bacterium]